MPLETWASSRAHVLPAARWMNEIGVTSSEAVPEMTYELIEVRKLSCKELEVREEPVAC